MTLPSVKEQEAILKYLIDIPSLNDWQLCDTENRKEHWVYCKHFYLLLQVFLKNHFAGLPLPTRLTERYITIQDSRFKITARNPDDHSLPLIQQVGLYLNYYLAVYAVLSWGWGYIEPALKANEYPYPGNPGEALIEVIDEEFIGRFTTYFPEYVDGNYYVEFSPRKRYELRKKADKIKLLERGKKTLTRQEKNFIERYKPKVEKEKGKMMRFYKSLLFYLEICEKNKAKDMVLRERLKSLAIAATAIRTHIDKLSHPRNKVTGYAINRGVRIEAEKGGIYPLSS